MYVYVYLHTPAALYHIVTMKDVAPKLIAKAAKGNAQFALNLRQRVLEQVPETGRIEVSFCKHLFLDYLP